MDVNELIKLVKQLEKIPPRVERIELYRQGYDILCNCIATPIKLIDKKYSYIDGIPLFIMNKIRDVKVNQCKVIYSDCSYKILDVFNINYKELSDYNK